MRLTNLIKFLQGPLIMKDATRTRLGTGLAVVGTAHQSICPVHGIIPNTIYFLSGTGAATSFISETKLGQLGEGIHDYLVDKAAGGIALVHPDPLKVHESHKSFAPHLEQLIETSHVGEHRHEGEYKDSVYHMAEAGVTGLNLAIIALGVYNLGKAYSNRRNKAHCCEHQ